ncbi:ATP-binding protein [Okeania sp.]|uniref:ATP-binding protein n=1 Tax=Okeania sp. TaxID=3100323 RepID=UPI002B4B0918|nr:ATP-binding protein [Okeania sp.]MEB3342436.1 ATP-binding protein [Okeania sp.]
MIPEQFIELARVLPEPSLLLTQAGEILALNKPVSLLFGWKISELKGELLCKFVTESEEALMKYLQACSKSRKMVFGSLTICTSDGESIICRSQGAVIQPALGGLPAQIFLRLEKRNIANQNFLGLNEKIDELKTEVEHRRQAEIKLNQRLSELKKAQMQLIHQEKLSSLGQIAAGVAHEINNPVTFIHGNLIPAQEYAKDLFRLIKLYQQYYPNPVPEIQAEIEEIDLDFLIPDMIKLLQSMSVGTTRIRQIVESMRSFSRLDEAKIKKVDIHQGLDSTLMILQHRLKATPNFPEIKVIKSYGKLPQVECHSGQLNQVFMNILTNAIDALHERYEVGNIVEPEVNLSEIKVKTEILDSDWVAIQISDNGLGISEQVFTKIFDPFFTTKKTGKGAGLGLSISHKIITEIHGGKLLCDSKLGEGTRFLIKIPVKLKIS